MTRICESEYKSWQELVVTQGLERGMDKEGEGGSYLQDLVKGVGQE